MRLELKKAGHEVEFVAINASSALDDQQKLIDRCAFPLLQDTDEINVWGIQGGVKDDIYVYDTDGALRVFLPASGSTSTNLSSPQGYANLKNAILGVVND